MTYQLVLQLPESIVDFEALIALEEKLLNALADAATVDGHDFGSGEGNIFVLTGDPNETLRQVLPVLEDLAYEKAIVAYRTVGGTEFTVLWPRGHHGKFSLA